MAAVKQRLEVKKWLALRMNVKEGGHLRDIQGVKRRYRNENILARPSGLR